MANPQLENGYTSIANELFEAIYMRYDFTKRQLKVLSAIIRHTYGWHQTECTISQREISAETGITAWHVADALKELVSCSVLEVTGCSNERRTYKLVKDYESWDVPKTGALPKREHKRSRNGSTDAPKTGAHTIERKLKQGERKHSPEFLAIWELYPAKKRRGLDFVTEEDERAVLANAEAVRGAISQYLRETDETYICKAETFFRETWKAYTEPAEEQTKSKFGRTLE